VKNIFKLKGEKNMPNWTYNTIEMNGIGRKRSLFSISESGRKYFDFNKLVPEPKNAAECIRKYGKQYIDNGNCHLQHTEENQWFNWYDWHCDFWGTKWNGCDSYINSDDSISFSTAWSEPTPIFKALSKKYPKEIIHVYATYEDGFETESTYLAGRRLSYTERELKYEE